MSPSAEATRLARKLAALPEAAMREIVLVEYISQVSLEQVAQVLHEFQQLGRRGGPPFNIALHTLALALSQEQLPYEVRAGLYTVAKQDGLTSLSELFLTSNPAAPAETPPEVNRELTLGHRKSLAKSSRREVLDRLLRNPEPAVVPILLSNPRLVEKDVVTLAARRPTQPEIQWAIFSATRWIARYAVKRAMTQNPFTPSALALRLLGFLTAPDLHLISTSPHLPSIVREAAARRL